MISETEMEEILPNFQFYKAVIVLTTKVSVHIWMYMCAHVCVHTHINIKKTKTYMQENYEHTHKILSKILIIIDDILGNSRVNKLLYKSFPPQKQQGHLQKTSK